MTVLKIATYQGPFSDNIPELLAQADRENVDILCMPECYLQGYFKERSTAWEKSIELSPSTFAHLSHFKTTLLLGLIERSQGALYDTVAVIQEGRLLGKYRKAHPSYDYFTPGREFPIFTLKGIHFGIIICKDAMYIEPARILAQKGAQVIFCPMCNKAPLSYHNQYHPKLTRQKSHFIARSFENSAWFITSDCIWPDDGQEICAGYTSIYNPDGEEIRCAKPFQEELLIQEILVEKTKTKRIHGDPELVHLLHTQSLRRATRLGVYGVAISDQKILLVEKKKGPYRGLFDLPGGGIEWGESPEQTLAREFAEETALRFTSFDWLCNLSHTCEEFHHLGQIYRVHELSPIENAVAEETLVWQSLDQIALETLTPFAQATIKKMGIL